MKIKQNYHNFIPIWEYIKSIYKSKYLFKKLLIFFVIGLIVLTLSFVTRQLMLDSQTKNIALIPGFIGINIIGNNGISFSFLRNADVWLIYFIQCVPVVIAFFIISLSRNIWIDVTISFIFFGGLANVIDRSIIDVYKHIRIAQTNNAVVDYFQFTFIKNSAIFNIPDVFIVLSTLVVVVYLIVSTFIHYTDKKHQNDHIEGDVSYETGKDIENEKNIETKKDIKNIKEIKTNKELIE